MHHVPSLYRLPLYSSPYRLLPYIAMPMCDKIHHIWIISNDHFYKTNSFVFKPKAFWMLHLNNHLYIQNHVSFYGQRISRVSPQASHAFLHFHELPPLEICITTCTGSFTQEGVYPYLLLPDTYFHFHVSNRATLLDFIQRFRVHQSITKHSVDSYHALTPMSCDVFVHNAMRCTIACVYYVTYLMNVIWTI